MLYARIHAQGLIQNTGLWFPPPHFLSLFDQFYILPDSQFPHLLIKRSTLINWYVRLDKIQVSLF